MFTLDLPRYYVWVYYENGKTENVASTDTLSQAEAEEFKAYWEPIRGNKIVRVCLENSQGGIVKGYTF